MPIYMPKNRNLYYTNVQTVHKLFYSSYTPSTTAPTKIHTFGVAQEDLVHQHNNSRLTPAKGTVPIPLTLASSPPSRFQFVGINH
jgi:hypothetical protein